jgi:hypothetical protein
MHGWADGVPELRPPQAIDQPLASGVIPEHWPTRAEVSGSTDDFWPLGESNRVE